MTDRVLREMTIIVDHHNISKPRFFGPHGRGYSTVTDLARFRG